MGELLDQRLQSQLALFGEQLLSAMTEPPASSQTSNTPLAASGPASAAIPNPSRAAVSGAGAPDPGDDPSSDDDDSGRPPRRDPAGSPPDGPPRPRRRDSVERMADVLGESDLSQMWHQKNRLASPPQLQHPLAQDGGALRPSKALSWTPGDRSPVPGLLQGALNHA